MRIIVTCMPCGDPGWGLLMESPDNRSSLAPAAQDTEVGNADPQSPPPTGHLLGKSKQIDSACLSSRAAPGDTAVNPAETSVPGGGGGCRTRSSGRPVPYSLGPRDSVAFD